MPRTEDDRPVGTGCDSSRTLLPQFVTGRLDSGAERIVREHLAVCDRCRSVAIEAADPTALFLELRGAPIPDSEWTGFMDRLRQRVMREPDPGRRAGWGALFRYPRLAYVATPLAMVLVLAATVFVIRPGSRDWTPGVTRPDAIRSPYDRPVSPPRPRPRRVERAPTAGVPAMTLLDPGGLAAQVEPPALEEVRSPGARVYRFDLSDGDGETSIYMVVDESIDF